MPQKRYLLLMPVDYSDNRSFISFTLLYFTHSKQTSSQTSSMTDDDPFACFDDDSDGEQKQEATSAVAAASAPILVRDPECGVLAFHRGTEQSLLIYVQNAVLAKTATSTPYAVMKAVDDFCTQRHWMMHVGPNKSLQLETFLRDDCLANSRNSKPFILLELGTYCGYSSIFWASTLMRLLGEEPDFHVYTVEANPEFIHVARGLIELAGLTSKITVLHLDILGTNQQLIDLLKMNNITCSKVNVDLVFFDHDKDAYLDDLQELEKAGIVRKGVHVAADNVLFARIDGYRNYMQNHADNGIVQTKLVKGALEYSEMEEQEQAGGDGMDFEDGIGKCMV
jgi:catechol O-methyltransferase